MHPDFEEQRTPRSLADMLGLRDRHHEPLVIIDTSPGLPPITRHRSRSPHDLERPISLCSTTIPASEQDQTEGEEQGHHWSSSTPMLSRRRLELVNSQQQRYSSLLPPLPPASGESSETRRRSTGGAVIPQQARYTSLLDIAQTQPLSRSHSTSGYEAGWSRNVRDIWSGGVDNGEERLPTYEEAVRQPAVNVQVAVLSDEDIYRPEEQRRGRAQYAPQQTLSPTPPSRQSSNHRSTHSRQPSPSHSLTISAGPSQPSNSTLSPPYPPITTAAFSSTSSPTSPCSSLLPRFLRRRKSQEYIRPPPPQEGIPLELVCDKFGNRRRDIVWGGTARRDRDLWLGSLGQPKPGWRMRKMGFAGRSVRWEGRYVRRNDMSMPFWGR